MTETGVIAMYIRERGRERERWRDSSVYGSVRRSRLQLQKYTSRHTNPSIKRLIGIHALTDGEWWKYTLKIQRMQMKASDCIPAFQCKATLKDKNDTTEEISNNFCSLFLFLSTHHTLCEKTQHFPV